ncbi:hypothetical protein E2C01_086472 [Portunus trituberculatus]|uniref:Uncharacterized protein n=1 Tax=Portunus trituberculatus TaxID=210409 RepID=A0A5B7J9S4_PORTR|nr:hypothetical protein [Portunus trituberculatus]
MAPSLVARTRRHSLPSLPPTMHVGS